MKYKKTFSIEDIFLKCFHHSICVDFSIMFIQLLPDQMVTIYDTALNIVIASTSHNPTLHCRFVDTAACTQHAWLSLTAEMVDKI